MYQVLWKYRFGVICTKMVQIHERSKTRQAKFESIFRNNRICCFFTICKSRSGFGRIFCTVKKMCMSKNTSLIWQISFNLQIHHCFLSDRPIACSWYIKNRKKPRSWSFYFLFKIFRTRDIIHSEKSGICSDGNRKLGFVHHL
jgi:hypothetical protein